MNLKDVWNDLYWDGKEFVENYIPYLYEVKIARKGKDNILAWQMDMWCWYFNKMDIVETRKDGYRIWIYGEKPIDFPKQKTVLGETYTFEYYHHEPSKQGGAKEGIKEWFTQKIALTSDVAKKFPYTSSNIFFKYDYTSSSELQTLENYTKLALKRICKEHNICFTYDWSWHYAFLASFEPIKKEVIDQVKKELGAYIKNENC